MPPFRPRPPRSRPLRRLRFRQRRVRLLPKPNRPKSAFPRRHSHCWKRRCKISPPMKRRRTAFRLAASSVSTARRKASTG
ncbi:hypothetical protein C0J26_26305 [Pseudomonas baetica]|nr:hypothetical protein C0J26_26305 [Pseudomonas baetica]